VSSLERRCRWLLRAYPAWYRRTRGEEMLGTLLEASPPGRRWPSVRDARALVIGGLRVRGRTWLLSMLWVGAGVVITGYFFYVTTKPYGWADVTSGLDEGLSAVTSGTEGWSADPVAVQIAVVLAQVAELALPLPVLIAGFIRLRGWRRGNWLRAAAWAGAWIAGLALMAQASAWGQYPYWSCPDSYQNGLACPIPSPAVVSWGELAICAAWPVLGAVMTRILAGPPRRSYAPDPTSRASHEASRWPPGAGDLQT
jgi:hypothetical protein